MSLASRLAFHCSPDFPFRCLRGSSTPCDATHTLSFSFLVAVSTAPSVSCRIRSFKSARACAASRDAAAASGASISTP